MMGGHGTVQTDLELAAGQSMRRNAAGTAFEAYTPAGGAGPSDTVQPETSFEQSSAPGSAATYSRADHTHGSPTDPVPAHAALTTAHAAATNLEKTANKGAASGYAPLDTASKVPLANLGGITNSEVASGAAIAESKLSLSYPTHSAANDPTAAEKAALPGTSGAPSATNKYVTNADPRNSDARTPTAHNQDATTINAGTLDGDRLPALSATKKGGAPATGAPSGKFLRDDATWAAPGGGGEAEVTVRKTADTANATTAMADAVGLTLAAEANSEYWVRVDIYWITSAATVGIKLSAAFSGAGGTLAGQWLVNAANGTLDGAAFNANDVTVTTTAAPFTGPNVAQLWCFLKTAAAGGNLTIRFAAETTGTITIKAGSILRHQKTL